MFLVELARKQGHQQCFVLDLSIPRWGTSGDRLARFRLAKTLAISGPLSQQTSEDTRDSELFNFSLQHRKELPQDAQLASSRGRTRIRHCGAPSATASYLMRDSSDSVTRTSIESDIFPVAVRKRMGNSVRPLYYSLTQGLWNSCQICKQEMSVGLLLSPFTGSTTVTIPQICGVSSSGEGVISNYDPS